MTTEFKVNNKMAIDNNYQNRIQGSSDAERQNRIKRYSSGGIVSDNFRNNNTNQNNELSSLDRGAAPRNAERQNNIQNNYRDQARQKIENIRARTGKDIKQFDAKKRLVAKRIANRRKALAKKSTSGSSSMSGSTVAFVFVITLILALVTDILDFLSLSGILAILTYLINICFSFVITMSWLYVFSGSSGNSKNQSKWLLRSFLLLFGAESIPIVELLPFNAIAVILNYMDYRKANK